MRLWPPFVVLMFLSAFLLGACWAPAPLDETAEDFPERSAGKLEETKLAIRHHNVAVGVMEAEYENFGSATLVGCSSVECYALTNAHVIETIDNQTGVISGDEPGDLAAMSYDEQIFEAELIDFALGYDLALIAIPYDSTTMEAVDIRAREGKTPENGELVFSVGSPRGLPSNVTMGRFLGMTPIAQVDFHAYAHSSTVFSGNSGGGLFDLNGDLLGINAWAEAPMENQAMAIPLHEILDYLQETIETHGLEEELFFNP